jgi:hypothetical protein
MKSEIPIDDAAPSSPATRARLGTALTVTTHHLCQRHWTGTLASFVTWLEKSDLAHDSG